MEYFSFLYKLVEKNYYNLNFSALSIPYNLSDTFNNDSLWYW